MNTATTTKTAKVYSTPDQAIKGFFKKTATLQSIANNKAYSNGIKTANPRHDDIFSIACEKTVKAIESLNVCLTEKDILNYYKRSCVTVAIDILRAEHSLKRDIGSTTSYNTVIGGEGEGTELVNVLPSNSPQADYLTNYNELVSSIDSVMERLLSDDENFLLRAFYFEGKKINEIALENGIPVGIIKATLFRAKGKLAQSTLLQSMR
jgi:RNA polymerase sigma factor (sigma-70 family)